MRLLTILAVTTMLSLPQAADAATVLKGGNAPAPASHAIVNEDPWIGFNHPIFQFNLFFDRNISKPIIYVYDYVPRDLRRNVSNFLGNLSEPLNAVHGILQADAKIFFTSLWRFILNSTFGLGGIRDFAREQGGLHNMPQDLGKTLGRWGVAQGPYLVLPILGPSTARDTTGKIGDWFLDPVGWALNTDEEIGQAVADAIDIRDNEETIINQLYYESIDPYAATRSAYLQHEAFKSRTHQQ